MFVGYPALGKTSFFRAHFGDAGYAHVNQDTLKTRDKCVKAAEQALADGQSVVVGERAISATAPNNGRLTHIPRR